MIQSPLETDPLGVLIVGLRGCCLREFAGEDAQRVDQVYVIRHKMLVERRSQRQVAKEFGVPRVSVRKYVEGAAPVRREAGPR